jgi:ribosomal protein L11 methyltransferase
MSFKQLNFTCKEEEAQILIAELSAVGYDVFEEKEGGFTTSIPTEHFDKPTVDEIVERYSQLFQLNWEVKEVERVNWNEEWEKNYEPVEVEDKV